MFWHKKAPETDLTDMSLITPQEAERNAIAKDQTVYSKAQKEILVPFTKWFNERVKNSVCYKGVLVIEHSDIPNKYRETLSFLYRDKGEVRVNSGLAFKDIIMEYLKKNNWEKMFCLANLDMVFSDTNNKTEDNMIQLFKVWLTDSHEYSNKASYEFKIRDTPRIFLVMQSSQPFNDCLTKYLLSQGYKAKFSDTNKGMIVIKQIPELEENK